MYIAGMLEYKRNYFKKNTRREDYDENDDSSSSRSEEEEKFLFQLKRKRLWNERWEPKFSRQIIIAFRVLYGIKYYTHLRH